MAGAGSPNWREGGGPLLDDTASSHNLPGEKRTSGKRPTEKRSTCHYWVKGACESEEACELQNAHELFPVIVERADANGIKTEPCGHWNKNGCYWPDEHCGFAHEEREVNAEVMRITRADLQTRKGKVADRVRERPWEAKLVYVCKACDRRFADRKGVKEHCATPGECSGRGVFGPRSRQPGDLDPNALNFLDKRGPSRSPQRGSIADEAAGSTMGNFNLGSATRLEGIGLEAGSEEPEGKLNEAGVNPISSREEGVELEPTDRVRELELPLRMDQSEQTKAEQAHSISKRVDAEVLGPTQQGSDSESEHGEEDELQKAIERLTGMKSD